MNNVRPRSRGRPLGSPQTRTAILDAARLEFARCGYDRATIRRIAGLAGVDAALVHHYYGSKRGLFVAVLDLGIDPGSVVASLIRDDPAHAGARIVQFFLSIWETPRTRWPIEALVRSAAADPDATLAPAFAAVVSTPIVHALGQQDAPIRAALCGAQLVGLAFARYIVRVEPLASAATGDVIGMVAPSLQRYLFSPLTGSER
jgi:AcrR family transcriptional regulator